MLVTQTTVGNPGTAGSGLTPGGLGGLIGGIIGGFALLSGAGFYFIYWRHKANRTLMDESLDSGKTNFRSTHGRGAMEEEDEEEDIRPRRGGRLRYSEQP